MKSRLLSVLLTGFALALGFLIAVQVSQSFGENAEPLPKGDSVSQEELNQTVEPVLFKSISEQDGELRLSGTSEAGAVVIVQNKSENYRQIKTDETGYWATKFSVVGDEILALGLLVYVKQDALIRSEETLYRIPALRPAPEDKSNPAKIPALIMVTAPGGPTRVIQSPFARRPIAGALAMGPIDYDERGSVIFSGTSEAEGNVRIFAKGELVGQSQVAVNGRWFFIAVERLPLGQYDIKAELTETDGTISVVTVPFSRLKDVDLSANNGDQIIVSYEPTVWQVARSLFGGGRQYTAIFGSQAADEAEPNEEPL